MTPPDTEEKWTIGRLLRWTTEFLQRKGSESPRLEAEVLLAHVLALPRVKLYTSFEDEPNESDRKNYRELVKRRAEGTPVAYLVEKKEFYGLTFHVNPNVLVPRPETEYLVLEFLTAFKGRGEVVALDVGTGSGCVALACLQQHKTARFVATDLSPAAVAVANRNADALKLKDRFRAVQGSLYESVRELGPFDAIVSNPPYIRTADLAGLDRDVRGYEPVSALDGGKDGLRLIEPLIQGAARLLKPEGRLFVEFGYDQGDEVRRLVDSQPDLALVAIVRDGSNHPRVLHAKRAI